MARRLEALAQSSTESHMHDMGYWGERAKRSEFATAAFTVGSSKRSAQKVAAAAMRRVGELSAPGGGGAAAGRKARDHGRDHGKDESNTAAEPSGKLPPIKSAEQLS